MRRSVGVGAVKKQTASQERFSSKGAELAQNQLKELSRQLNVFKEHLTVYARKHRKQIKKDGDLRRKFLEMCALTGVDPLASRTDGTFIPLWIFETFVIELRNIF
ncbi:hypothetical protein ACOME3_000873 [Neoechinorhynchus agilis]